MNILARIDYDCKCLSRYFKQLYDVLQKALTDDHTAPVEALDAGATESLATYHGFSHLIKPDMVMNIYSLVDYWLAEICAFQKNKNNRDLRYRDIKGKHDLHAYQKYLTRYVGIDLSAVEISYSHLNDLRKVRNCFIHGGGHVLKDNEKVFSAINGITLFGSLIIIDDDFIWTSLDHAKKYLCAAAQA